MLNSDFWSDLSAARKRLSSCGAESGSRYFGTLDASRKATKTTHVNNPHRRMG
jgi:hypothetical protein